MGKSNINDVQVGLDTKISLVSNTKGRKRVPLAQTLAFTPKKAVTAIGEFDNRYPVITYESYEGANVAFETFQADQVDVDAMMMDLDSNQAIIVEDPANNQVLKAIYCNFIGRNTGYQYGAEYIENCRMSANPTAHAVKSETKRTHTFEGTRYFRVGGKTGQKAAIQYVRFTDGAPVLATPDDVLMGSHTTGSFPNAPVAYPLPVEEGRGATQNYISAFRTVNPSTAPVVTQLNGNSADGNVDFVITNAIFTLQLNGVGGAGTNTGDIVEFFVVVQPTNPIS